MSLPFADRKRAALWTAGLVLVTAAAWAAEDPAEPPPSLPLPKAEFVADDLNGKDPFFPNSTRRVPKAPVDPGPEKVEVGPALLTLRGITGPPERRIALINNRTFEAGEEAKVRVKGTEFVVKCEEIRERSVIITLNGEQHEIRLLDRVLPLSRERAPE